MSVGTILITAVNALFPLIITILLGYILKCRGFLTEEFLRVGNKVVFNICLPAMLGINVYDIAGFSAINWEIVLYAIAAFFLVVALGLGIALLTTDEGRAEFGVDTALHSVSSAIECLTRDIDVRDLSVSGQSTEELVVSLYEEFRI